MSCPCKGCQERTDTCHGTCEKYKSWKAEHEKKKEWLRGHVVEQTEPRRQFFNRLERKRARGQCGKRFGKGGGD